MQIENKKFEYNKSLFKKRSFFLRSVKVCVLNKVFIETPILQKLLDQINSYRIGYYP